MEFTIFGGEFLNKLKKTFLLISPCGILLVSLLNIIFISLTITAIINYKTFGIGIILLISLFTLICVLGLILCFHNSITVDKTHKMIIVKTLKIKKIDFNEILKLDVDTNMSVNKNKYCKIYFNLKDGNVYTINGYLSILRTHDVEKSKEIVQKINTLISSTQ